MESALRFSPFEIAIHSVPLILFRSEPALQLRKVFIPLVLHGHAGEVEVLDSAEFELTQDGKLVVEAFEKFSDGWVHLPCRGRRAGLGSRGCRGLGFIRARRRSDTRTMLRCVSGRRLVFERRPPRWRNHQSLLATFGFELNCFSTAGATAKMYLGLVVIVLVYIETIVPMAAFKITPSVALLQIIICNNDVADGSICRIRFSPSPESVHASSGISGRVHTRFMRNRESECVLRHDVLL
ncbi:hypothetical protein PLICRDRAFT_35818 [Plicaturopsis crispa FD-325 SS-3]|nr:hypothetical protein PLICRDRAFT_35818 [Plicaturopsis crispa FD-325 SS-3]